LSVIWVGQPRHIGVKDPSVWLHIVHDYYDLGGGGDPAGLHLYLNCRTLSQERAVWPLQPVVYDIFRTNKGRLQERAGHSINMNV
jgi:hypothetical protein